MLKLKGNKGITLIALIITIIVLLILAGVTISAINGNENTMGKAKIAKEENEIANELEAIKLAITDAMAKGLNGKVSDVHLRESIAGIIDDSELNNISGEGPWTIKTKLGKTYEINGYGQIEPAATPTDIYVTLDGDTLRFYAQKDNVSGTLVKEKNSDEPINLRGEGFTKSASDNPWYNNTNIKKVSFEEVVVPTSTMRWFVNCSGITNIENIERLNTRYVTNMNRMFYGCSGLTELDLSKFSTENVTDMSSMFSNCSSLTELDLSKFNTENVTDMPYMFYNCSNLKIIYVGDKWNTDAVAQSDDMFTNCNNLTGGAGTICSLSYRNKSRAKIDRGTSDPGYLTHIGQKGKPKIGEYIILGNAIEGIGTKTGNSANEDDWKILCNDETTGKIYAILDSYLPTSALPASVNLNTTEPYAVWKTRKSVENDDKKTLEAFIAELTDKTKWRSLVSNTNSSIEVYGALPKEDGEGNATEGTMDYVRSKIGSTKNSVPSNASSLSGSIYGYWLASSLPYNTTSVWEVSFNGNMEYFRYYDSNKGVCPVAIIPVELIEKNSKNIWQLK